MMAFELSNYKVGILLLLVLLCWTCREHQKNVPDVSKINANINLVRFEELLFNIDTNNIDNSVLALRQKYPHFSDIYFNRVLTLTQDSAHYNEALKNFINDKAIRKLKDTTSMVMGNLSPYKDGMKEAFLYIKYYFPEYREPNIYTFISEFGFQRFIFSDGNQNGIGIGLDLFLGEKYPYKELDPSNAAFSDYLTRSFNKDHMIAKSVALLVDDLVGESNGNKFLDLAINNGKKLYLMYQFLPFVNDTIIHEYTASQMKWVQENELEMWSFFAEQNLIYESNLNKINKYLNPSPDAPGMPEDAPGKTGNYIGMKIVESYMKKFPNTTLKQLIAMKDSQKFMELSKYKPRRK